MRFHVLGVGAIGTLVSHHLRHATSSPISLIFKRAHALRRDPDPEKGDDRPPPFSLAVQRGQTQSKSTGFDIEKIHDGRDLHHVAAQSVPGARNGKIDSLIVCLKTVDTIPALRYLSPRLSPTSVITLLQNGMGVYDQLCLSLFPDPNTRPHFVLGTTTHGVTRLGHHWASTIRHVSRPGEGELKLGVVPDPREQVDVDRWLWRGEDATAEHITTPPSSPRLPLPSPPNPSLVNLHETLSTLLGMSDLSPSLLPMPHLHHQLLLKLAINSVINPLTSILGLGALPNGALIDATSGYNLISLICSETSAILTAYIRSLSDPYPPPDELLRLFAPGVLEARCRQVIFETVHNTSSMAADISSGRIPEIENINGYLLSLATRLNVPAPTHKMLIQMVKYISTMSRLGSDAPALVTTDAGARRKTYGMAISGMRSRIAEETERVKAEKREAAERLRAEIRASELEARMQLVAVQDEAMQAAKQAGRGQGSAKTTHENDKRTVAEEASADRRQQHQVERRRQRKQERLARTEMFRNIRAGVTAKRRATRNAEDQEQNTELDAEIGDTADTARSPHPAGASESNH